MTAKKLLLISFLFFGIEITAQNNNAVLFKVSNANHSDETIVRMKDDGTTLFDALYDAVKLFSWNPLAPSIYTETVLGLELSVNTMPLFEKDTSLAIFLDIPVEGTYQLEVSEFFPFTSDYKYGISNLITGEHFEVQGDTIITFEVTEDVDHEMLFVFNISHEANLSEQNETCANLDDGSLVVEKAGNSDWDLTLSDDDNQMILFQNVVNESVNLTGLEPGSYNVKIEHLGIVETYEAVIEEGVALDANFAANEDTVYISELAVVEFSASSNPQTTSYSWSFGDGGTSNDQNPSYEYFNEGTYDVELQVSNGVCTEQASYSIVVLTEPDITTGIADVSENSIGIAYLGNGKYTLENEKNSLLRVYDLSGKLVLSENLFAGASFIDISSQPKGLYIFSMLSDSGIKIENKVVR